MSLLDTLPLIAPYGGGGGSDLPLSELARIRGAMWSVRSDIPLGAAGIGGRQGNHDNVTDLGALADYSAADQATMIANYRARRLTHGITGPFVDPGGYHGLYPAQPNNPTQATWDAYLDVLDRSFWANGIAPIFFLKPDGWSFEQTRDVFEPFLLQPRSQRVLRIIVPVGWEPDYDVSSFTHALFGEWIARIMPNTLRLLHLPADRDAPAGTDAHGNDDGVPDGITKAWNRVTPYLHGFLIQNGPYPALPANDPTTARNFAAQFKEDGDGAEQHSLAWHFRPGGPWARQSAWGPTTRIRLYNGECTAYNTFWGNLPEPVSQAWGDLAMASGADGYLDGGTVDVPAR